MAYNSANPFAPGVSPSESGFPAQAAAEAFPGYFPNPEEERKKQLAMKAAHDQFLAEQAEAKKAAELEEAKPQQGIPSPHDIPQYGPSMEQMTAQPKPYTAVRQGGKTIFTNQDDAYAGQGDVLDMAASRQEAMRVQPEATRITSPYDVARNANGAAFGSAMTRPGMPGGYVESQQDWTKVANPGAFDQYHETPPENILAQREAALARSQQEKASAEALTQNPYGEIEAEGRAKASVAMAPFLAERAAELEDRGALDDIARQITEKYMSDRQFIEKFKANPEAGRKFIQDMIRAAKADSSIRESNTRYTVREDGFRP